MKSTFDVADGSSFTFVVPDFSPREMKNKGQLYGTEFYLFHSQSRMDSCVPGYTV